MTNICNHTNFVATANVIRIDNFPGRVVVELSVVCSECRQPVIFDGLTVGSLPNLPTTDALGAEARLPGSVGGTVELFLGRDLHTGVGDVS